MCLHIPAYVPPLRWINFEARHLDDSKGAEDYRFYFLQRMNIFIKSIGKFVTTFLQRRPNIYTYSMCQYFAVEQKSYSQKNKIV